MPLGFLFGLFYVVLYFLFSVFSGSFFILFILVFILYNISEGWLSKKKQLLFVIDISLRSTVLE